MQTLRLKITAATNGEPYRSIADGRWNEDGTANFPTVTEAIPQELLEWFSRLQAETQLSIGTWNHDIGNTRYQVAFTAL
jgi:hypothetical protein